MVKLWPFGGDNNSASAFERTLSTLTGKIQRTTARNDKLRQRSRKLKVGWTLYAGFAYILSTVLLVFVTGWQNWSYIEYAVVTTSPVIIWGVRRTLTIYHEYWIKRNQEYLNGLEKERTGTIEKLKKATQYDSTQELIDKYSTKPGAPEHPTRASDGGNKNVNQGQGQGQQRVFTNPPPTANIPRAPLIPATANIPRAPAQLPPTANIQQQPQQRPPAPPQLTEEFAPNAFDTSIPAPVAPATYGENTWYDRILDALLGDDETSAKNRFALICSSCKLVNGQAPPGAKTLQDVGKWRCSGCGAMNGVENHTEKLVEDIKKLPLPLPEVEGADADEDDDEDESERGIRVAGSTSIGEEEDTNASRVAVTKSGDGRKSKRKSAME